MTHPATPLPTPPGRLVGLPPVVGSGTVVLVLGSFPGVASLRAQQYYAHPHNHFWRILQALWPQNLLPGPQDYAARCDWLLARGLGLWDVYGACEREGSLDARIRNAEVNDFALLHARCQHAIEQCRTRRRQQDGTLVATHAPAGEHRQGRLDVAAIAAKALFAKPVR